MASSGTDPSGSHPRNHTEQYQKVRLSPEELRTLRDCNRESFYYRCLPLGVVAMTATHWAVKSGYLKPNVKWGSTFKVLGAGLVSYFIGKFSYQKQCAEKLMQLPNSTVGDALRRRYGRTPSDGFDNDQGSTLSIAPDTSLSTSDYSISPNVDSDRNIQNQGLDDSFRPTVDGPTVPLADEPIPVVQPTTTYDELRQKNREEHDRRKHDAYGRWGMNTPSTGSSTQSSPTWPRTRPSPETSAGKAKNKYGDEWED